MPRILLIKLTSLGDLIHVLPAISDAASIYPDLEIDWVVDENFHEVATWHRAINKIIVTNHRKWRGELWHLKTYQSLSKLIRSLRQKSYDLVIDGQGNFKSALLTMASKGLKCGFDKHSVREKIAHLAYRKTFSFTKKAHAIERLRQLFAHSLDYHSPNTPPDFQIDQRRFTKPSVVLPESFFVFVPNASWETKLWPESHWIELINRLENSGYTILLPWGNSVEKARAMRLSQGRAHVMVLPKLSLSEVGYVLSKAKACISVDTGLSHIAAALAIPTISLYGATDSGLIGTNGSNQIHLQSTLPCAPCYKKQCAILNKGPDKELNPPCLGELTPDRVFQHLLKLIQR